MSVIAPMPQDTAVEPECFDIHVITAGRPTQTVAVTAGSTLAELAELVGADDSTLASALTGTGDLVDAGYELTAADERISFIQRLAGARV